MTLTAADIAADLDIMDGLTTVSVLQVHTETGATLATAADVTVLRRAIIRTEAPVEGGGTAADTVKFHLKAADMAWIPKKRDRIVDAEGTWQIQAVTHAGFSTRYICETSLYAG